MEEDTNAVEVVKEGGDVAILFKVDVSLRDAFKSACKAQGVSMSKALERFMLEYVSSNG